MKYCLSSRQTNKYLTLADEIKVQSRDYRQIPDLFVDYPDKMIILDVTNENLDSEEYRKIIEQYSKASNNFCCAIYNLAYASWFEQRGIKFYYGYPINSYYDMRGLIDLGVEYIKITAPLTFDMDTLVRYDVKFRMVPNVAYDAYVPRCSGIYGQWVRPEDITYYEDGVYIFEFEDTTLDKEQTLFDIYNKGVWPGNLNLLITNLNYDVDNRTIPEELGKARATCKQRCMETGACHFCEAAFRFEKTLMKYKENKTASTQQDEN